MGSASSWNAIYRGGCKVTYGVSGLFPPSQFLARNDRRGGVVFATSHVCGIADWIPLPDKLHSLSHGGLLNLTGTKTPSPPGALTAMPASVSAQTPQSTEQDHAICLARPLDSRTGQPRSADLDLRLYRP